MKLKSHKVSRQGTNTTISGRWVDAMRREAGVKISLERGSLAPEGESQIMTGDVKDVNGVLYSLADVAWEQGWRPRGLMGRLAYLVESYKLPRQEG